MRQILPENWTLNDLYTCMEQARGLIQQVSERVDIITEVGDRPHLPKNFLSAIARIDYYVQAEPNVGVNVLVSRSTLYRMIHRIGSTIHPQSSKVFRFASSVDEARSTIISERTAGQSGV